VLKATGAAAAGSLILPFGTMAQTSGKPATILESISDLFCIYIALGSGRVAAMKSFTDVNPEIREGKKAKTPYLTELQDGFQAQRVIQEWIGFYNTERPHSALEHLTPIEAYWVGKKRETGGMKPKPDTPWKSR